MSGARMKATNEQIIAAYKETGSVWAAAKRLGMAGQTIHGRLTALNYPLAGRAWGDAEIDELRALVGHETIANIAHRLGRPYAGVACKISELGIGIRFANNQRVKIPRGAGYDKASIVRYSKQIDASGSTVNAFARRNGLGVEALCGSFERHLPDWWEAYRRAHSDLPEKECPYCGRSFVPSSGKQQYCTRKCGNDQRTDQSYFGGKRRTTIGLAEGRCQLCGRAKVKALSSHHILGKENDPDNRYLIALCSGCHKIVSMLAARTFVEDVEAWEALIQLCMLRHRGVEGTAEAYVQLDFTIDDEGES